MTDKLELEIENLGDITDATIVVTYPRNTSISDRERMADILRKHLSASKWLIIPDDIAVYNMNTLTECDREKWLEVYHAIGEALSSGGLL